ncbi:carbohydrate ABC transporter permease [bacterium]|nr:carbohydrate ABC transporter permease [bacterium]
MKPSSTIYRTMFAAILGFALLSYLYPLAYMVFRSVLAYEPGMASGKILLTFDHYREILGKAGFPRFVFNSVLVLFLVVPCNAIFATMVGYAFSRYKFPIKKVLFLIVLATLMVPKQTLMIPILDVSVRLNLHDTLWILIIPFIIDSFNIFLMKQYIDSLPSDLEDAARVDGASEFQILRSVIFPLCKPALAIVVINTAIVTWNSFLFPLILTDSTTNRTLPVGLAMFVQGPHSTDWGALMAGATISSLPMIVIFFIFQREIIEGITAGALKD